MAKLYLFCIGGTGSRVLRSLTMMLASGVKINADEIVPVIIDADHANEDLTRTQNLVDNYNFIRKELKFDSNTKNQFWGTKINTDVLGRKLLLPLTQATNKKFKEYIGYSAMTNENKAFASMLFSERNLEADMEVGFKGNPNIGSVVLNQFSSIQDILSSFNDGDRIFVVSSIFGGTGASGFPLLVKNLRTLDSSFKNSAAIKNSIIGAITVLPYFDLKPSEESEIDSSTFISKTTAALRYYEKYLTETNVLYYVADRIRGQYENHDGGRLQKNNAHVVEFISALSIIDFMAEKGVATVNGEPQNRIYKEFGVNDGDKDGLTFTDFDRDIMKIIGKPLTEFALFAKFLKHGKDDTQAWVKEFMDKTFFDAEFYNKGVKIFIDSLLAWYEELRTNHRSFDPFDLDHSKDMPLFDSVRGKSSKSNLFGKKASYATVDKELNDKVKDLSRQYTSKPQLFVELFYSAIEKLVSEKIVM